MDTAALQTPEVDLHRLELRFAEARLLEPRAIESLARSIEQSGQLIACIAVPDAENNRLILVDGYRRVLALRRLGRDTAWVESWTCDLAQALLMVLAQAGRRPFAALEEALLLQELVHGQGLSEREVARRSGRDVSWVSRRLELVCGVSDSVLAAVRQGVVSTWAATRVLAPLARANTAQATELLAALAASPLTTRELQTWFRYYRTSPRAARARMVSPPPPVYPEPACPGRAACRHAPARGAGRPVCERCSATAHADQAFASAVAGLEPGGTPGLPTRCADSPAHRPR